VTEGLIPYVSRGLGDSDREMSFRRRWIPTEILVQESKRLDWYPSKPQKNYASQCNPPKPCNICTSPSSYNPSYNPNPAQSKLLHLVLLPVERTPNTSHTLIQTLNRLRNPLQRLSAGVAKQQRFLQNLVGLHVAHANGFLFAADVFAFHDGVAAGSGGDCDFDLRVVAGESCELGLEERAGGIF
jgi:hypothetical protein